MSKFYVTRSEMRIAGLYVIIENGRQTKYPSQAELLK